MLLNILQWIYVGLVVLVLFNLTIFFHELGHFLVARWMKVIVERFAIWFGPALWKKMVNKVEYRLGCIPLGGYVLIPQLATEAIEGKSELPPEELNPLRPRVKIPILFAGSLANFLFGIVIACLLWVVGVPRDISVLDIGGTGLSIGFVEPGSPEEKEGIRAGDRLISIDGKPVRDWTDVIQKVALSLNPRARLEIDRAGRRLFFEITPTRDPHFNNRKLNLEPGNKPVVGWVQRGWVADRAGIQIGDEFETIDSIQVTNSVHAIDLIRARGQQPTEVMVLRKGERKKFDITPAIRSGGKVPTIGVLFNITTVYPTPWETVIRDVTIMVDTFNALLHPKKTGVGINDLAGPPLILGVLAEKTHQDIRLTLEFLVLLNINLAILNLLPIPVLDGGHILFAIIETIRRRPLNRKFMELVQTVFAVLIIAFMLYVSFNDIQKYIKIYGSREGPSTNAVPGQVTAPQK
jgi:regulator of sigma E protease